MNDNEKGPKFRLYETVLALGAQLWVFDAAVMLAADEATGSPDCSCVKCTAYRARVGERRLAYVWHQQVLDDVRNDYLDSDEALDPTALDAEQDDITGEEAL